MPLRKLKGLSDNPGTAILQALDDLRACERAKGTYVINMGDWHYPFGEKCSVCLAGSVMARRDALTPEDWGEPNNFQDKDACKLRALNLFRIDWAGGLCEWLNEQYIPGGLLEDYPEVPDYHYYRDDFYRALRAGAKRLEREWPSLRRQIRAANRKWAK